jgi:uncharacterized spore protein YtfJ
MRDLLQHNFLWSGTIGRKAGGHMDLQTVINNVADKIKDSANVRVVFGEPIDTQGVTIIPVATVKLAGGGGGGNKLAESSDGSVSPDKGMGMGVRLTTTPVGYIEVRDGEATMIDIVDKNKLAVGGLIIGGLVVLTFAKLFVWKAKHR